MSRSFVPVGIHAARGALVWLGLAISAACIMDHIQALPPPAMPTRSDEERTAKVAERNRLWIEAGELRAAGKLDEALERLDRYFPVQRALFGDITIGEAEALEQIAGIQRDLQQWAEASSAAAEALAIRETVHGPDDWRTVDARLLLADVERWSKLTGDQRAELEKAADKLAQATKLSAAGKHQDSIPLAQAVRDTRRAILGEGHRLVADALIWEGFFYNAIGDYAKAKSPNEQALKILEHVLGKKHPDYATSLNNLAPDYEGAADLVKAAELYRQAVEVREHAIDKADDTVRIFQTNLMRVQEKLAVDHQQHSRFAEARKCREEILSVLREVWGAEHWKVVDAKLAVADVDVWARLDAAQRQQLDKAADELAQAQKLSAAGKHQEAISLAQAARETRSAILGDGHRLTADAFVWEGYLYNAIVDYAKATPPYERALTIREQVLGKDHPDTATSLSSLGDLYFTRGNYAAAEPLYQRALAIREKVLGPEHRDTATSLNSLGRLYQAQGNYAVAEPLYQRALKICEKAVGPEHPLIATSLNNLASLYVSQGNYTAAEPLYQRALTIREKVLGPDHPDTATSLSSLGDLYFTRGNYAAAEPLFQRALTIREKAVGPEHPLTATSLNNLAQLYQKQGNYAAAEPLFQRALKIREKVLGPDHPDTATSLSSLAGLYRAQGNYAAAELLYQRTLKICEKVLGPEHPSTATRLNNLAVLYYDQSNYAAAEPLYQRALGIREKVLGPEHPDTAATVNNLASLYNRQGNYAAAEPLFQRALTIYEKAPGSEHPDTAQILYNLASLYQAQGNYAAAEPLYQRALGIREKVLGPEHPDTAVSLNKLALLRWNSGSSASARPLAGRGLDVQLRQLEQTAAIQTEQQQFLMMARIPNHLNTWLTVTSDDPNGAGEAWRHVLAWKGLTTTRQVGLRQVLKDDPTYAEFRHVSQQLSTVSLSPPLPPSDPVALAIWNQRAPELRRAWQEQKAQWEAEYQRLEKELSRKSATFHQEHRRRAVTPEDVIAALRDTSQPAALVDLISYFYFGRKDRRELDQWRMAAFVIRSDGKIQRIELGASQPIVAELVAWRERFGQPSGDHDPGHELRHLLLGPLEPYLAGTELVLVSPVGVFAELPWGALPGAKPGTYLIEERSIAVIPVPQMLPELLQAKPRSGPPPSLLVAGDIDYGGDPGVPQDLLAQRGAVGRQRDGRWLQFPKLDNAQSELASIRDRYEEAETDGKVQALRRLRATEAAFREDAPQNAWVHLITHGFFAPAELSARLTEVAFQEPSAASRETAPAAPVLAGIGAALKVEDGHCLVKQLVAKSAAAKDGRLQVGDEILAVAPAEGDWSEVKGKELATIIAMIRGPVGTAVRVKVRPQNKPDQQVELTLTRAALPTAAAAKVAPINPGLLSGLAFAGANTPPEAGKDDGILTALEVSALDLSKVDTVVLSACETGLGKVTGGEGLLGLQRSFQVAGAKTVVASLWKVPDAATSKLMERFYENLWDKKMGKLAALREAQIWMIRDKGNRGLTLENEQPADASALPPFYWAAFVLSGDWR